MSAFPWFRWYSGSVTDPKFQLVARRAGVTLPAVLAVWAYLLESAGQAEDRGCFGGVDTESLDVLFGFPDGDTVTRRVLAEFEARGLTKAGRISAWDKRQPKRERDDKTAAARQRAYRERQDQVTPSNASTDQKTPRGDKRREDKKREDISPTDVGDKPARARSASAQTPTRPEDVAEQTWADWLALRRQKRAPVTETVLAGARQEADKAGMPLDGFLQVWCRRGSQGLEAAWLKDDDRRQSSQQARESFYERDQRLKRQQWEEMTGCKWPAEESRAIVVDVEPSERISHESAA